MNDDKVSMKVFMDTTLLYSEKIERLTDKIIELKKENEDLKSSLSIIKAFANNKFSSYESDDMQELVRMLNNVHDRM